MISPKAPGKNLLALLEGVYNLLPVPVHIHDKEGFTIGYNSHLGQRLLNIWKVSFLAKRDNSGFFEG